MKLASLLSIKKSQQFSQSHSLVQRGRASTGLQSRAWPSLLSKARLLFSRKGQVDQRNKKVSLTILTLRLNAPRIQNSNLMRIQRRSNVLKIQRSKEMTLLQKLTKNQIRAWIPLLKIWILMLNLAKNKILSAMKK